MNRLIKPRRSVGIVLFCCGILADMLLFSLLTWAGLEAYFYFDYQPAQEALGSLSCPLILTSGETGQVSARFSNPSKLTLAPQFQVEISSPELMYRTVETAPAIAAGETKQLQWAISSQDVVFGHLILAEVYVAPVYGTPDRLGRCGTLWLDLPWLTGRQLFAGWLAASLLLMGLGWGFWMANRPPKRGSRTDATGAMLALTGIVLFGTVAGSLGWWMIGVACLVLSLLLIVSTLEFVIQAGK